MRGPNGANLSGSGRPALNSKHTANSEAVYDDDDHDDDDGAICTQYT